MRVVRTAVVSQFHVEGRGRYIQAQNVKCGEFDCGILGLLTVQTGTIENFWFEPGFDSDLITFIRANPLHDANLSCFEMSFRYAERFLMGARYENPAPAFSANSLRLSIRCFIFE